MSYEVRNPEIEHLLRRIANLIKKLLPKGWGFTLILFEYGSEEDKGSTFYMSTATRDTMIEYMKEFIRKNTQ